MCMYVLHLMELYKDEFKVFQLKRKNNNLFHICHYSF